MKRDVKSLDEGVVLFRGVFADRIAEAQGKLDRETLARELAKEVNGQFIEIVAPDDPEFGELIEWAVRVLRELSKDSGEVGNYAAEVMKLIQGEA